MSVVLTIQYFLFIFFFSSRRRHTRYIGDWSSDVCSSDLALLSSPEGSCTCLTGKVGSQGTSGCVFQSHSANVASESMAFRNRSAWTLKKRSEERRVGKECRYRWWRDREKEREHGV